MRGAREIAPKLIDFEICNTFLSIVGFLELLTFFMCRCRKFVGIAKIDSKYIEMFFLRQNFFVPHKLFLRVLLFFPNKLYMDQRPNNNCVIFGLSKRQNTFIMEIGFIHTILFTFENSNFKIFPKQLQQNQIKFKNLNN